MIKFFISFVVLIFFTVNVQAQEGRVIRFQSANAMFPDSARMNGHTYDGKHYPASLHYSDSSILIYIPKHFSPGKRINFVFWFHGWGNNIDSACNQFKLIEQFESSGRNAVFVFPEGPKDAPDSYGGKLEKPPVFQQLVKEVYEKLAKEKIIKPLSAFNLGQCDISLAGHSGAYRVISRIINQSPIQEVILFDAMYGGNDAYLTWIAKPEHRFIHIYTKEGGTFDNSLFMIQKLKDSLHVSIAAIDEEVVTPQFLASNKKIFIFSKQSHNDVIRYQRNWERFLQFSPFVE